MTTEELKERFGHLIGNSNDWTLEDLLNMSKEQLLLEYDRIKAAEERLHETDLLLEAIGWNRRESTNKRSRRYIRAQYDSFKDTVLDEKRNISGLRRENAKPNTIIYLQDLANMIYYIYQNKYGVDSETGKINDKYTKKFQDFFFNEYKAKEE